MSTRRKRGKGKRKESEPDTVQQPTVTLVPEPAPSMINEENGIIVV